jgi:hypothetical protein
MVVTVTGIITVLNVAWWSLRTLGLRAFVLSSRGPQPELAQP